MDAFRQSFRVVEVSQHSELKGKDEKDYLSKLYSSNTVFATGDASFINYVQDNHAKHAGIVYIPEGMGSDEKPMFAAVASGFIQKACTYSKSGFRNQIIYPGNDGLHAIVDRRDEMQFSWDRLVQLINID